MYTKVFDYMTGMEHEDEIDIYFEMEAAQSQLMYDTCEIIELSSIMARLTFWLANHDFQQS